ncbi:MAG: DoxX family protein, partial [Flavobacteriales bacterium]|nr:DoxX family protein [Flavobacteriales bacterium]
MKLILTISRILVGSLFIVSGLIKANDALGFKYKLEEYFEPGALNLTFLEPFALELAIFVCVAEVLLGIALLTGAKAKLTAALSLLMMLFFTWLTYYTHTCDPHGVTQVVNAAGEVEE